jgi:dephospho-CoA kinase
MRIFIGLTGTNAAGKGEAAAYLVRKGFRYHSLSDVVRSEATRLGRDHGRDNLIEIGNRLRSEGGSGALARRVIADLGDRDIIDSIRHPAEIEELRKLDRFFLLGVDAPIELRFERSRRRARIGDAPTLEAFRRTEEREMEGPDSESQQIRECLRLADARVWNEDTLDTFHARIVEILTVAGIVL